MESSLQIEPTSPATESANAVHPGVTLLTTLYDEKDLLLFRPVETWIEGDRKKSRVDYKHVRYRHATRDGLQRFISHFDFESQTELTNQFFGVCPRVADEGRSDLAWQIRTVRCLWADIDNCDVAVALERVASVSLPYPTAVVNSGNGVHLYWLLERPFVIDDAGPSIPVHIEPINSGESRKKARRYVLEGKDRVYLDQRHHLTKLSPKALQIQDILAGIAEAIGGDHTTDLTRLLRVPGTYNRKDQRNGRQPILCELIECDTSRSYALSAFAMFHKPSETTRRQRNIDAMPLPTIRKLSASKTDKLSECIAVCAIAREGTRSEADFAMCCNAIRSGFAPDEVWQQVESVGKFAEAGRPYFDRTWANAQHDVRTSIYEKLERRADKATERPTIDTDAFSEPDSDTQPKITVNPKETPVATTMEEITSRLAASNCCYTRANQLVVVNGESISPILSPAELTGLLNQYVELFFITKDGGEFRPLPTTYANTWLNNVHQRNRLPAIKLFSHNPVYTEDWRLINPGYDPQSCFYYAGPAVEPLEGTKYLDTLLSEFCFASPSDRTNFIGILLTSLLMSHFIGSKPAVMFNGNQSSIGKSTLAQTIALIRDGTSAGTVSYNENDEEFEKRLGTAVKSGATTIIIDNAKTKTRKSKIDSACLERSITDPILSYRLLGHSAEIRAENSHIFCITANAPDVSPDLVTRSVVINLHYLGNPKLRKFSMNDPESYVKKHRQQLLSELVYMVERWKDAGMPFTETNTRFNKKNWGNIVGGILYVNGEPDFLDNADEAAASMDNTRREFAELVGLMSKQKEATWNATEVTALANKHFLLGAEIGDGTPRSQSTRMGVLAGRYEGERFKINEESSAVFQRNTEERKTVYYLDLEIKPADV